jgi:hypothetical protein
MLIGLSPYYFPLTDYQSAFQITFKIGVLFFLLAYVLYAVKCWGARSKFRAVLMISIPLLAYSLATSKIPDFTTSILLNLVFLLCIFAIISAILLYICDLVMLDLEGYLFKNSVGPYWYFNPKWSYSFLGLLVVSIIAVNYGGIAMFSNNLNNALQSTTNYDLTSQYASPQPTLESTGYSTVQTTPTSSITTLIPTATENYEIGPGLKSFPFVLRGVSGYISITLYSGVESQIESEPQPVACVRYNDDTSPCNSNELDSYYLQYLNEPTQTKYLDELVDAIRTRTSVKDDQVRIAVSLVQNIPYDYSKLYYISTTARYPYEVLYDNSGICEEKSLLLAYILRGLGYGVVLFDYPDQRHMAVGIKSSGFTYDNSDYAFIESTTPSIITDYQGNYLNIGKLTEIPVIYQISDGSTFNPGEDGIDAIQYESIESGCEQSENLGCALDNYDYTLWESLVTKYGLK